MLEHDFFFALEYLNRNAKLSVLKELLLNQVGSPQFFKMRFSAIFVLVLVCALVVDAHFHQVQIQFDHIALNLNLKHAFCKWETLLTFSNLPVNF